MFNMAFKVFTLCFVLCGGVKLGICATDLDLCEEGRLSSVGQSFQEESKRSYDVGFKNVKNAKQESHVKVNLNLVFLTITADIQKQEILPVLGVGTLCFVSGYVILHCLGVV